MSVAHRRSNLARDLSRLVILLSFGLRVVLCLHGGQKFWTDEGRFGVSESAANLLRTGQLAKAVQLIFGEADHLLFKMIGIVPAMVEQSLHAPLWSTGLFFALVSTWVLWLIGRVARAAGGDDTEAFFAVFFAAASTSLFYYSRHFFPYDLSLGFMLLGLLNAFNPGLRPIQAFKVGLWVGLGFLTYNGYWTVGAAVLSGYVALNSNGPKSVLTKAGAAAAGLLLPMVAILIVGRGLGVDLFRSYLEFSKTVTQGDFGHAWRFVGEYLFIAEHGIAVLWGLVVVAAITLCLLGKSAFQRTGRWLVFGLLLYGALVVPSDYVHKFAISARHVRAIVPFLCLLTASLVAALWNGTALARKIVVAISIGVCVQAGLNFTQPLGQVFPDEFRQRSITMLAAALVDDLGPYKMLNVGFLRDPAAAEATPRNAIILAKEAHPFQFLPYLYEGYTEASRRMYRKSELSMRLVRLDAGGTGEKDYPGVIKLRLRFPSSVRERLPEPLVATGRPGAGDVLFFRYPDPADEPDVIQFGLDHIGGGATYSQPIHLDRGQEHEIVISMPSLWPRHDAALFQQHPDWLTFKKNLFVTFDGEEIFKTPLALYEAERQSITVGMNLIGASTATDQLTAEILAMSRVSPASLVLEMPVPERREDFAVSKLEPGQAAHICFLLPDFPGPVREPLLTLGRTAAAQVIYVRYTRPKHIRFGIEGHGLAPIESEEVRYEPSEPQSAVIWAGAWAALSQQASAPMTDRYPPDKRFTVVFNNRVLLDTSEDFVPQPALATLIGFNPVSAGSTAPAFSGRLTRIESLPYRALSGFSDSQSYGVVDLAVRLPLGRAGVSEPLVTTGKPQAGDFLYVRYLDNEHVRFSFDHWGLFGAVSDPIKVNFSETHRIEVKMPSLYQPQGTEGMHLDGESAYKVEVRLDGQEVFKVNSPCYPAGRENIGIGVNEIGGSTTGTAFTGQILSIRRATELH